MKKLLLLALCLILFLGVLPAQATAASFADPAFESVWKRTDKPVADGRTARSWVWGPEPFTEGLQEPYAESPGGTRTVQYFDKSRMEINDPNADRSSQWFVTNGLLVREMTDGRIATGNSAYTPATPAQEAVAGDPVANNPNCPTYASFTFLTWTPAGDRSGQKVTATIARDGTVGDDGSKAGYSGTEIAHFEPTTGHNVPRVLWDYMNAGGLIYSGGYRNGQVVDWLFAMGYPISEPYWARCTVGGVEKDVLVQLFERRVLTYTPSNSAGWQVEMGNVGRHYYTWRYGGGQAQPPAPTPAPPQNAYSGSGDAVIDFSRPAGPAIVHVTGNAESGYFGITSYGADGSYIDLLVNTADPYDGIRPLDFEGQHATRFQVQAPGAWTIEILPLSSAHTLWVPGSYSGANDDVIVLAGVTPDKATISGNGNAVYFGMIGYTASGAYGDLLVNTTDPYQGTVIVERGITLIEVMAEGGWTISVTGR